MFSKTTKINTKSIISVHVFTVIEFSFKSLVCIIISIILYAGAAARSPRTARIARGWEVQCAHAMHRKVFQCINYRAQLWTFCIRPRVRLVEECAFAFWSSVPPVAVSSVQGCIQNLYTGRAKWALGGPMGTDVWPGQREIG